MSLIRSESAMNNAMNKSKEIKTRTFLVSILLLSMMLSGSAFASDIYRVSAQFYHLGELIAAPQFNVRGDETTSASYSKPGESQYKFVVLVRPQAVGEAYVSMQFSSGKINIQPDLMVKLGEETSATINKLRLTILVQAVETSTKDTIIAFND